MTTMTITAATRSIEAAPAAADLELVVPTTIAMGWHPDPMAIHKLRWHDGAEWTEHVTHHGPVPCRHCGR